MKRFAFFLILTSPLLAIVPSKIEWYTVPSNTTLDAQQFQVQLLNPTSSGDAVFIGCTYGKTSDNIGTIASNVATKWTKAVTVVDSGATQSAVVIYSTGTPAGVRTIMIPFTSATRYTQCIPIVLNNIATGNTPIDATCGKHTSGTAIGCGAMTTSTAGDQILTWIFADGTLPNAMVQMTTATTNFAMWGNDSNWQSAGTYGNMAGTGVIDSTVTMSASMASMVTVGVAAKTASGGGAAGTGIYVKQGFSLNLNDPQTLTGQTSFKVDFPVNDPTINLISVPYHTSGGTALSSVASSPANVWVTTTNVAGSNKVGHFYAANAVTNSTMTITVTLTASPGLTADAFTATFFGVSGASTTPVDAICSQRTFSATQTSGTLTNQPSCTLAGFNELITAHQQEDRQTVTDGSPGYSLTSDSGGPYSSLDFMQDGGWQIYYAGQSSGTVSMNWVYSYYEGGSAIGDNTGSAISWKPADSVVSTPSNLSATLRGALNIKGSAVIK